MRPWHRPVFAAATGIDSTVGDMLQFMRAQIDPDTTPIARSIRESRLTRMRTGASASIRLAWQIVHLPDGTDCIWHNGQTGRFTSSLTFHPATRCGVVALTNSTSNRLDQETRTMLAALVNGVVRN